MPQKGQITKHDWEDIKKHVCRAGYIVYRSLRAGSDSHWSYRYNGETVGVWNSEYETYLHIYSKCITRKITDNGG